VCCLRSRVTINFACFLCCCRFGRVVVIRASALVAIVCGIAVSFSPSIYVFALLRFFLACFSIPVFTIGVVYGKATNMFCLTKYDKVGWQVSISYIKVLFRNEKSCCSLQLPTLRTMVVLQSN